MNDNRIYWVRGNTQELLIPLEQEIVPQEGEVEVVPYYPDAEATVQVRLVGKYRKLSYTPTVDGNLLRLTENATLPSGVYGVEVVVENPDGTRYRSLWDNQIVVTDQNDSVLQEWDEFRQLDVSARAAVFFFAKGDKGDAFTYDDFTPEQIAELQKPASDAAEELTQEVHTLEQQFTEQENHRIANENQREENEASRVQAESVRHQQFSADHQTAQYDHSVAGVDHTTAGSNHETATQDHTRAEQDHAQAGNNHATAQSDHMQYTQDHEKEMERESAETLRKQSETQRQTNENARQQAESQRAETFADYETFMHGYDDRLSALEITQEQFNSIFND